MMDLVFDVLRWAAMIVGLAVVLWIAGSLVFPKIIGWLKGITKP